MKGIIVTGQDFDYEEESQNDTIRTDEPCPVCGKEMVYSIPDDAAICETCGYRTDEDGHSNITVTRGY